MNKDTADCESREDSTPSQTKPEKVNFDLTSVDGNAFSLMGGFSAAARRQRWTNDQIKAVTSKCMEGDYNNLVAILAENCR